MNIDKLIDYISQFEPTFSSKIRGATETEIKTLEELTQRSLPKSYVNYLKRMGHDDGGLYLAQPGGSSDLATIIQNYQDMIAEDELSLPDDCILLCDYLYPNEQLVLRDNDGAEPTVWWIDSYEIYKYFYAESLEKLLWRQAFLIYQFPILKKLGNRKYWNTCANQWKQRRELNANELSSLYNLLGSLGFEKQWFSDEDTSCATREDAAIIISDKHRINLLTKEQTELEKIGKAIEENLNSNLSEPLTSNSLQKRFETSLPQLQKNVWCEQVNSQYGHFREGTNTGFAISGRREAIEDIYDRFFPNAVIGFEPEELKQWLSSGYQSHPNYGIAALQPKTISNLRKPDAIDTDEIIAVANQDASIVEQFFCEILGIKREIF
jgi:hypothetical protein